MNFLCNLVYNGPRFAFSWLKNERAAKKRIKQRMKLRMLRIPGKPFHFHKPWCRYSVMATCTCGRETFYSPSARRARGEIE